MTRNQKKEQDAKKYNKPAKSSVEKQNVEQKIALPESEGVRKSSKKKNDADKANPNTNPKKKS